jgi:DNA-binding response OmpR family regulator
MADQFPPATITTNVLVIEDDPDTADLYLCALARTGFGVRKSADRQGALNVLNHNRFQVIIMDVMMPGLSLDAFMSHRSSLFPMSRIILVSAYPEIEQAARRHQINYWLRKPFDPNELSNTVSIALPTAEYSPSGLWSDDSLTTYTLAELLELERQFVAYGALLFCPADHPHVDGELEFHVRPANATIETLELLYSVCKICGREMHAGKARK